ncbi:hypothetical protein R3P38DRAFT_2456313, partial [Favolaschia claudopus]
KNTRHVPLSTSSTLNRCHTYTPPESHYHISSSRNFHFNLTHWLGEHQGDPALTDFRPKLQEQLEQLLARLWHPNWSGDGREFTAQERNNLLIVIDHSMNPRTHADIMTLAPDSDDTPDDHPFCYARIIGVFHCDAASSGNIEFFPDSDPNAYGFLDPDEVIRASHLIPAFHHGPTDPVEYTTLARKGDEFDDWRFHYVN